MIFMILIFVGLRGEASRDWLAFKRLFFFFFSRRIPDTIPGIQYYCFFYTSRINGSNFSPETVLASRRLLQADDPAVLGIDESDLASWKVEVPSWRPTPLLRLACSL